jgi:ribosomal protein S18 acetylase RimI-like enzyme
MWRSATAEDEPAVVRLYLALDAEDPGTVPPDPARAERTLALFRSAPERGSCLVLDEGGGRVDGYALLVPYWSNELGGLVCCLDEIYVARSARGRGRASELLALLATGALPGWRDVVALQLEVSPTNERARALYERHGLRPIRNVTLRRLRGGTP